MRQRLLAVVALFALTPPTTHAADNWSGNDLLPGCIAAVQKLDGKSVKPSQVPDSWLCRGFVSGYLTGRDGAYIDVVVYQANKARNPGEINSDNVRKLKEQAAPFCLPDSATVSQIVRVFSQYMMNNPQKLSEHAGVILTYALVDAFPCQQ